MKFSSEIPSLKVIKQILLVVFLTVCGLALFLKSVTVVTEFAKTFTKQDVTVSEETRIRNMVEDYSNLSGCNIDDFYWFGFNGPTETELVVRYRLGKYPSFTDIFTLADPENPVRLYHGEGSSTVLHCSYDGVRYLFIFFVEGSGSYIYGRLFSWDETGPMTVAYRPESLINGGAKVVDDQLFFSGDGKLFRLDKTVKGFELVEYTHPVDFPDLGWNSHIVRATRVMKDSLSITFNGKIVPFVQTQNDGWLGYSSRDTFKIGLNEEIIILGGSVYYSVDDFQSRGGDVFSSFVPSHKGDMHLSVTIPYAASFSINFLVFDAVFLH